MTSKIKIKTSELVGAALDWAVAKCEGLRVEFNFQYTNDKNFNGWWQLGPNCWQPLNSYSSDWSKAGPVIERERIFLYFDYEDITTKNGKEITIEKGWRAHITPRHYWMTPRGKASGDTPLVAAMRCYVASKLGDEVEVPEELMQ